MSAAGPQRPPAIVAAAPTGAHKQRADYPNLPITPADVADEAHACLRAGACMLHLHVRDDHDRHTIAMARYRPALDAVRARCGDDLLIQATTEAAGVYDPDRQAEAILELDVDFLSLALPEIVGEGRPRDLERTRRVFRHLDNRDIAVQIILYRAEQRRLLTTLEAEGVIPARTYPLLFVLGRYHQQKRSTPEDLEPFLDGFSGDRPWMICAFGEREIECMMAAAARGGDVRVGFENNTVRPDGSALERSAESISRVIAGLNDAGMRAATANEARARFGVRKPR